MKRVIKKTFMFLVLATFLLSATGCYGSFTLTKRLYKWNGTVGNKFVQSGVMWVLAILPVYAGATFIDGVVLNTIEFWGGQNPLAYEGEPETKTVIAEDGSMYEITMGNGEIAIKQIKGDDKKEDVVLKHDKENDTWYIVTEGKEVKIVETSTKDNTVSLYYPDGSVETKNIQ